MAVVCSRNAGPVSVSRLQKVQLLPSIAGCPEESLGSSLAGGVGVYLQSCCNSGSQTESVALAQAPT